MDNREVSVGSWLVVYVIMCIPLVNLIMLLVWAFGSGAPASQANWAKATLLWGVIFIVLWFALIGGMLASM